MSCYSQMSRFVWIKTTRVLELVITTFKRNVRTVCICRIIAFQLSINSIKCIGSCLLVIRAENLAKMAKSDAKQKNISAAFKAQEFKAYFYDNGGKMFCQSCDVVVDQVTK